MQWGHGLFNAERLRNALLFFCAILPNDMIRTKPRGLSFSCNYDNTMSETKSKRYIVRPAVADDVPEIHDLIKYHAQLGRMILRGFDELYADLRSFMVAEEPGELLGCASVHLFWNDLAELKCVAVNENHQRRGIGRAVVDACHADLRRLGISRAFCLTGATAFFEKLGYRIVAKDSLPRFIWGECVRCPSFPVCNEEALVFDLTK